MFFISLNYSGIPKYSLGRFCPYENDLYDTLDSYFLEEVKKLPVSGYTKITADLEYRPDLLSYKLYGDTQYWWLLMYYNNTLDISELTSGKEIKFFNLTDLELLYLSLKPMELSRD